MKFDVAHSRDRAQLRLREGVRGWKSLMTRAHARLVIGRLVIDSIHLPSSLAFVHANEFTILQLQIPFGAYPGFFVPPISSKKIRTALIADFSRNFRTANMREGIFIQQDGCRHCGPKSS